jgi:hypothetical protein
MEKSCDLLRMVAHVLKSAEEGVTKILRGLKESVVCDMLAGVLPDPFGGIQFWPVGRELEDLQITAIRFEPIIGFLLFVIGRVVLNQVDPVTAAIEGRHDHLLQERQIGLPLKVTLLMKIDKTGIVQTDGSENLLRVALPACGNLWLTPTLGPSRVQSESLPKRSLICKNNRRPFGFGVFLDSDMCSAPTCAVA